MKKIYLLSLIVFASLFFSGCSLNSDFSKFIENKELYFDKDIKVSGNLFFENSNYYLLDSNEMKLKLINCQDKYKLENNKNIELNGFLTYDDNLIFSCGVYNDSILKLNSEILEKSNKLDDINLKITESNTNLINLNNEINKKNSELNLLKIRVDNATLNKNIDLIKKEITEKMKSFPEKIKIDDFREDVMNNVDYTTERSVKYSIGGGESIPEYWIDVFYLVSKTNHDYTITVKANRYTHGLLAPDDFYSNIEIIVENQNEKFICLNN